ncbi:MAG TPA: sodium/solute symporter [Pirellulales bacterium]|nr:sodium/solute symporter [Pirellulales bacterium]
MPETISGPRAGLETLDYVGVVAYLLATLAIVVWSSRKQESTDEFFLGSRRMPWLAVGMSLLATLLSTLTYLGAPGEIVKNGVAFFMGLLALPFSMLVVLCLWVPFFMRLRLTSAYEYLERRFDYRARLLGGTLFLFLRLGWMSLVIHTASGALREMTGFSIQWLIVFVGLSATLYTCVGGIRAAIWNDVLQFVMLFGGLFVTVGYVAWATGTGPTHWWNTVTAHSPAHTNPLWFSFDPTVRMTVATVVLHSFFWTICTHGADQVALQRYFATRSLSAARRSYLVNAVSDILVSVLLATSGLALLFFYFEHPDFLGEGLTPASAGDKLLPYFFTHQLPAGLGGLILAGFLCDAMQTLDSGVNSISAVATTDIGDRFHSFRAGRMGDLRLARALTLIVGILTTGVALMVAYTAEHSDLNIVDLMPRLFNMFLGPLASLFFIGMFLPRCTARSALPAVLCSLVLSIVWSHWSTIVMALALLAPSLESYSSIRPSITWAIWFPCTIAFLLAALLGTIVDKRGDHPGRAYSWRAVLRRPEPGPNDPN